MASTAIVVPFHGLPSAIQKHRRVRTDDGADGMPPHVTLIFPFIDDAELDAGEAARLRAVLEGFPAFDVTFAAFARFDADPPVLYLQPERAEPFLDMIAAIVREFPAFPPFGGVHETVIPHLTLAQTDDATAIRAAQDDVARHLPIRTRVNEVAVMEHVGAEWRQREQASLPLAE